MVPVLDYGASELWPYNYGPHDLGTYPKANGQCYNMGDRHADAARMPVEESANLILIAAAIAKIETGKPTEGVRIAVQPEDPYVTLKAYQGNRRVAVQ